MSEEMTERRDMVNAPRHYAPNGKDTFMGYKDLVGPEKFRGFLILNILKYVQRHEFKGTPVEDINKAFFYLAHLFFEVGGQRIALERTLEHAAKHYGRGEGNGQTPCGA